MAPGETKMALIEAEKKLRTSFLKRKKGLIKKVKELTILCDMVACVIIYGPVQGGRPPEIFTWPAEKDRVGAAIKMYKEKMDHSRRAAELCNYLKDRKRLEGDEDQVAAAGGGVDGRVGSIRPEVAVACLNWVDARIKAVEERFEFLKSGCQNAMLDEDVMKMVMLPAGPNVVSVAQDQNFGYRGAQEWTYQQNPYPGFADQFDQSAYYQSTNAVSAHMAQFQFPEQSLTDFDQQNQTQNQMVLYDPHLSGMEQNSSTTMHLNGAEYYQHQMCGDNKTQFSNNVAQPMIMSCNNMDDMMLLRASLEEGSSPDAPSSSSDQFKKAAAFDFPSSFEDQLEYLFKTAEFGDDIQPEGEHHGAGGGAL